MKSVFYYDTPVGILSIEGEENALTQVLFGRCALPEANVQETPLIKETIRQLQEYFAGERKIFDLPFQFHGTEFQKKVWNALYTIPYGEVRSYQDIAVQVGNPLACRAVGLANNRNPISIIVPCHRVIGKNGKLVGYGGGLDIKESLLELERAHYGL